MKPGLVVEIPGFGPVRIKTVLTDFTGTLSFVGVLRPGVVDRLRRLNRIVDVEVLTSDSFGTARDELAKVPLVPKILSHAADGVALEKRVIAEGHDLASVAAFGNGRNDRLMLQAVREGGGLAIAVDNGEGCAVEAMLSANVFVVGSENALDLLLHPIRLKATLRD